MIKENLLILYCMLLRTTVIVCSFDSVIINNSNYKLHNKHSYQATITNEYFYCFYQLFFLISIISNLLNSKIS